MAKMLVMALIILNVIHLDLSPILNIIHLNWNKIENNIHLAEMIGSKSELY